MGVTEERIIEIEDTSKVLIQIEAQREGERKKTQSFHNLVEKNQVAYYICVFEGEGKMDEAEKYLIINRLKFFQI